MISRKRHIRKGNAAAHAEQYNASRTRMTLHGSPSRRPIHRIKNTNRNSTTQSSECVCDDKQNLIYRFTDPNMGTGAASSPEQILRIMRNIEDMLQESDKN